MRTYEQLLWKKNWCDLIKIVLSFASTFGWELSIWVFQKNHNLVMLWNKSVKSERFWSLFLFRVLWKLHRCHQVIINRKTVWNYHNLLFLFAIIFYRLLVVNDPRKALHGSYCARYTFISLTHWKFQRKHVAAKFYGFVGWFFFFLRRIVVVNIEFLKSKWNASFVNFVEMYDEEKDMNLVREDDGER